MARIVARGAVRGPRRLLERARPPGRARATPRARARPGRFPPAREWGERALPGPGRLRGLGAARGPDRRVPDRRRAGPQAADAGPVQGVLRSAAGRGGCGLGRPGRPRRLQLRGHAADRVRVDPAAQSRAGRAHALARALAAPRTHAVRGSSSWRARPRAPCSTAGGRRRGPCPARAGTAWVRPRPVVGAVDSWRRLDGSPGRGGATLSGRPLLQELELGSGHLGDLAALLQRRAAGRPARARAPLACPLPRATARPSWLSARVRGGAPVRIEVRPAARRRIDVVRTVLLGDRGRHARGRPGARGAAPARVRPLRRLVPARLAVARRPNRLCSHSSFGRRSGGETGLVGTAVEQAPDRPRLSVIVPATDWPATLERCVDAIRRGRRPSRRDHRRGLAAALGPAAARNAGAARATGSVLVFVDSDVLVHADAFERIRAALATDPERVAVFGSYDDAPAADGLVSIFRNLLHHWIHHSSAGRATTFWAGLGAVRSDAFRAVGGFDARRFPVPSVEDIELGLRLARTGTIRARPAHPGHAPEALGPAQHGDDRPGPPGRPMGGPDARPRPLLGPAQRERAASGRAPPRALRRSRSRRSAGPPARAARGPVRRHQRAALQPAAPPRWRARGGAAASSSTSCTA